MVLTHMVKPYCFLFPGNAADAPDTLACDGSADAGLGHLWAALPTLLICPSGERLHVMMLPPIPKALQE